MPQPAAAPLQAEMTGGEAHAAAPGSLTGIADPMPQPGAAPQQAPMTAAAPLEGQNAGGASAAYESLEPAPSGGAQDRKRQLSAASDDSGARKQPHYYEFAKKKWESEEAFRLPDGTYWPEVRWRCLIWLSRPLVPLLVALHACRTATPVHMQLPSHAALFGLHLSTPDRLRASA